MLKYTKDRYFLQFSSVIEVSETSPFVINQCISASNLDHPAYTESYANFMDMFTQSLVYRTRWNTFM